MQHIRMRLSTSLTIFVLFPAIAMADSGEGLIEVILFTMLVVLNVLWPIFLPMLFLRNAKKKVTFYVYALCICGTLALLSSYVLPHQIVRWLGPSVDLEGFRVIFFSMCVASALAFWIAFRIVPKLRAFNDARD